MMTIAKKYLSNPEKVTNSEKLDYDENRKKYLANPENTSLIRKKRITPTIAYNSGVSMGNRGFWVGVRLSRLDYVRLAFLISEVFPD